MLVPAVLNCVIIPVSCKANCYRQRKNRKWLSKLLQVYGPLWQHLQQLWCDTNGNGSSHVSLNPQCGDLQECHIASGPSVFQKNRPQTRKWAQSSITSSEPYHLCSMGHSFDPFDMLWKTPSRATRSAPCKDPTSAC